MTLHHAEMLTLGFFRTIDKLLETDTVEPEPLREYKTVLSPVLRMVAMEQTARCQIAIELNCMQIKHV